MSLQQLFDKDPAAITDSEIDTMVAAFREQRKLWETEQTAAISQGRKAKPSASKLPPIELELDIKL